MKAFSPPSLYSKTSYSTERPSRFDQFPRSPSPSILTRKRRLCACGLSGIVSSSAQVRQEAGTLPINQQFCFQPAADPVVELSRELIHLALGRLARSCGRGRTRALGCRSAVALPADGHPILVPHGLQSVRRVLRSRVGGSGIVARPLYRNPNGWRQRQRPRRNVPRSKLPPLLGRVEEGGVVPHSHQGELPAALRGSVEWKLAPLRTMVGEGSIGEGRIVPHRHYGKLR